MMYLIFFVSILICLGYSNDILREYPKHVWLYYDGDLPQILISLVTRTRRVLSSNWIFHFLTPESIREYLDIDSFPVTYSLYATQAQSDLIRLALLKRYGGWWIDTSTIVNSDQFMKEIRDLTIDKDVDFFGYCFTQCPRMLIESSILYSRRNSSFVTVWEKDYSRALATGREAHIYQAFRDGIDLPAQLFKPYPYVNSYFTIYATERVAISRLMPRKTRIMTKDANDEIYKLFDDCQWEWACSVHSLRSEMTIPRYQVTKLWSWWRAQAWPGSGAKKIVTENEPKFRYQGVLLSDKNNMAAWLWTFYSIDCFCFIIYRLFKKCF